MFFYASSIDKHQYVHSNFHNFNQYYRILVVVFVSLKLLLLSLKWCMQYALCNVFVLIIYIDFE